ncbi:MAG: CarD family transcriptional regulator [Lachnospiraceae bacterium]|nr:CarD family transcriptional regulator [Lachnospiraceae bacterium]
MFEIGQYIVYGSSGVCKVVDIGKSNLSGMSEDRLYYTLEPCYSQKSRILTPTDNKKTVMRCLMTREEADDMIDHAQEAEILWIDNERSRESEYKNVIAKCDCYELIRVIKTIYVRKQERVADGKKVTVSDEKYFKIAEDNLYSELAIVYDMSRDEAKEYMLKRISRGR